MDPNLQAMLKDLTDQLTRVTTRLDHLEAREPQRTREAPTEIDSEPEFDTPRNPRRAHPEPEPEPDPRRLNQDRVHDRNPRRALYGQNPGEPNQYQLEQDDRAIRNIRLEAPTFDGCLDPKIYLDWEGEMDQYFEWFEMSEERKFRFAKLKLIRQARLYWGNLERLIGRRGENPIATWPDMKRRLRDKYLPMSYNQKLLDQWQRLTQGNKSVAEYIAKFDEYVMRCNVEESESVTLSRFRAGLREELQKELFLREVVDLEQAYQVARDAERFHRGPTYRRPETPRTSAPSHLTGPNQMKPYRPNPGTPLTRRDDRGKAPEIQRTPNPTVTCFRCHKAGHIASECPSKALHIGDPESDPTEPLDDFEE